MKKTARVLSFLCAGVMAVCCLGGCGKKQAAAPVLDPGNPIPISVWTYYNGAQLTAPSQGSDTGRPPSSMGAAKFTDKYKSMP